MSLHLLTRQPARDRPETCLTDTLTFAHGRVHELCGPARRTLAVMIAAKLEGPVIWIRPSHGSDRVSADGIAPHMNPSRIVFVDTMREIDTLWCAEEALRSGAAPVTIIEISDPPGLTPIRRLTLAGESAASPLALMLSPGDGGAQGVESRWHMAPAHGETGAAWSLTRLRARMAPQASWRLCQGDGGALEINAPVM